MTKSVRVRFAPAPTGLMHLGNVRTALFNYIFARQNKGTFIVRIEDTDTERNFDPNATIILQDLAWLALHFDEGPIKNGPYEPYFQSERFHIYEQHLKKLEQDDAIYRCFCSIELLEKKRARQIALKQPPRYDRSCLRISQEELATNLQENKPFIWRFKLPNQQELIINDLARGVITFDLTHFADFPLTREDGSFTFLFANAVDDIAMQITHIFRGEDHISNTPCQAALYQAFNFKTPIFWHMPVICNNEGKKLSKRDFGFSLRDLRNNGYLPEAICNYLAVIGGSFQQEIMNLATLVTTINFDTLQSASAIRYDVEKLSWINHQWMTKLALEEFIKRGLPFLNQQFPQAATLPADVINKLFQSIQAETKTLKDIPILLTFYFQQPDVTATTLMHYQTPEMVNTCLQLLKQMVVWADEPEIFYAKVSQQAKQQKIPLKNIWQIVRIILTGSPHGPGIKELLLILGAQESKQRMQKFF